jgi:hypothetical protein
MLVGSGYKSESDGSKLNIKMGWFRLKRMDVGWCKLNSKNVGWFKLNSKNLGCFRQNRARVRMVLASMSAYSRDMFRPLADG